MSVTARFVRTQVLRPPAVALALLVAAGGCARPAQIEWQSPVEREHPLVGKVWDVSANTTISEATLNARLAGSRFVILGERHDNPDHHVLQAKLVRALVEAGRHPAVGFEMLSTDDTAAVARYLARSPKDAAGLGDAVNWRRTGWPEWRFYQPIAQAALDGSLPIVATNLSRPATDAVRRNGLPGLGPALTTQLRLAEPSPETRTAMALEIREAHCGQVAEDMIARMVDIQWARDARMAASLARGGQRDGAVLIAGAGHARRDRGVPVHLARQAPGAGIASVAFVEVDPAAIKPGDYAARFASTALPFDYVWFTPKIDEADPCEKFKQSLESIGK
jgi:uncharacterized iron-regulated protein